MEATTVTQYRVFATRDGEEMGVGGLFLSREEAEEAAEVRREYVKSVQKTPAVEFVPATYAVKSRTVTTTPWE